MLLTLLSDRPRLSSFPNLFLPPDLNIDAISSNHTPFDSSRRADSNGALPEPGGCLADELYTFLYLLTSISIRSLRTIHYSIPLDELILTPPFTSLANA